MASEEAAAPGMANNPMRVDGAHSWLELAQKTLVNARRVRATLTSLADRYKLKEAEIEILCACARSPLEGYSQERLAKELAVSPAHVSGIVERLRREGLLLCSVSENDRRLRRWRLTPAGQTKWQALSNDSALDCGSDR